MSNIPRRPILALLTAHWITMLGVALVTTAGFSWLFVLPIHFRGHTDNPYIGIVVFIFIPVIFISGLLLIALGVFLTRRRGLIKEGQIVGADRRTYIRKLAIFFAVTTAVNIVIGTQGTYRAVEHLETVQFCGQTCHVMKPEFTAHENSPHANIECVDCHVAPGVVGWVQRVKRPARGN